SSDPREVRGDRRRHHGLRPGGHATWSVGRRQCLSRGVHLRMGARRRRARCWRCAMSVAVAVAPVSFLESVQCYGCGATGGVPFVEAEDDLTGKPGRFTFVRCGRCGLAFQNPRVSIDRIRDYYDDEYIAHRRTNWGLLNKAFDR